MEFTSLNGEDSTEHSYAASDISFTGSDLVEKHLFKCKQCNKTFTKNIAISQPAVAEANGSKHDASASKEAHRQDHTSSYFANPSTFSEPSSVSVLLGFDDMPNNQCLPDRDVQPSYVFSQHSTTDYETHVFKRQKDSFHQASFSIDEMPCANTQETVEDPELSDGVTLALECEEQDLTSDEEIRETSDSEQKLEAAEFSRVKDSEPIRISRSSRFKPGFPDEARHVCKQCDESFVRKKDLVAHVRTHSGSGSATLICPSCGKRFSQRRSLETHVGKHACEKKSELVRSSRIHGGGEKPYACSSCGKAFARVHALLIHQKLHSGAKPHVCTFCNKAFLYRKSLDCHMSAHTGDKQHVCAYCGKTYASKSNLVIHTRTHTGEKPFECSACGESFPYKTALLDHVIRAHAGEDSYRCSFCDKAFRSKVTLVAHTRIHTGERPFVCALCHIAFKFKGNLVMHEKTHTGEKPFACSRCDKAFVRHSHLVRHTRIHTGEKPYACSACDRAFTFREQLAIHCARVHTGEKPIVVGQVSAVPCLNPLPV